MDEKKNGKQSNWIEKKKKKASDVESTHVQVHIGIFVHVHLHIFSPQFSPHFGEKTFCRALEENSQTPPSLFPLPLPTK